MTNERLISEFNEAVFQIGRLHNIWLQSRVARESGQLIKWKWILDSAMIELCNDVRRLDEIKETDTYKEKLEKLDQEIESAEKRQDFKELYKKLKEKEMLLREIQEEAGKGSKLKSIEEDMLME